MSSSTRMILDLATRQHGAIATRQLRQLDVSWAELRGRAEAGWLRRVHHGVYVVAGSGGTHRTRWMAAVLAAGPTACLSHTDAAALWRLTPPARNAGVIHVTAHRNSGSRSRRGIAVHHVDLPESERARRHGIPVTTPGRTILDLATLLPPRQLERAIDEAEYRRLCAARDLEAVVVRNRSRSGTALLAAVLNGHAVGTSRTRTELEEMFLALCRERGLPDPLVNAPLLGLTVDFFWPPAVVVEVDGAGSHATRRGFQDDRDRDSLLAAHGYTVVRFTCWDVERRPAVVADRVRRVLRLG